MITEYIFNEAEAYVHNWFKQHGLPVYRTFKRYETKSFTFRTYANGTDKCFNSGKEVWDIELKYDYSKDYCVKLPTKYVKLDRIVSKTENPNEYAVECTVLELTEECSLVSDYIPKNFKPYVFNECAYRFVKFINWKLKGVYSLKTIDNIGQFFNIVLESRFEQITNYFTVVNLPAAPNLKFTFARTAKVIYHGDPNHVSCTYRLVSVRTTAFGNGSSDKKNTNQDASYLTDNEKERFKTIYMGSWLCDYVKDPTKVTVKVGNYTYEVVDHTKESEYVNGFDLHESDNNTADPVNHPNHYEMVGPFESFDIIVESLGIKGARYFCQGNIIKYQTRYKQKNGEEDLKKRHWYSRMDQMLAKCKTIEDYYKLKESDF